MESYESLEPTYPVRHRPKVPFQPRIKAPVGLTARLMEIQHLDAELDRHILRAGDYFDLVADAYATNFHYSTRLEGNDLGLEEVGRITRDTLRHGSDSTDNPPKVQEIVNHILAADSDFFTGPWSQDTILGLHTLLMRRAEPESDPGRYKTTRIPVTQGRDVVFVPARPEEVLAEMESLLAWVNDEAPTMHPLVAATVFFHEFESIHPFKDGNGRTGRMLFHGYLQTRGLPNAHLCKFEPHLTGEPEAYYRLLSWTDHSEDYRPLLDFVTNAVLRAYREAHAYFQERDLLSSGLDERARRLLIQAKRQKDWFSASEAAAWVEGITNETVLKYLNQLVNVGALEDNGKGTRAKRFRFARPFPAE